MLPTCLSNFKSTDKNPLPTDKPEIQDTNFNVKQRENNIIGPELFLPRKISRKTTPGVLGMFRILLKRTCLEF